MGLLNRYLACLSLRVQVAGLLGYASHADYVLEEKMAQSPAKVREHQWTST